MTKPSLTLAAVVAAALACACNSSVKVATNGDDAAWFSGTDVFDRKVRVGQPTDAVVALVFSGPATSDSMQPVANALAMRFRSGGDLRFVSVADLRSLKVYERPFAKRELRKAHRRTVARVNRHLAAQDMPPIDDLGDHLFLVPDHDGVIAKRFEVANPNARATCIVLGRDGAELGRFDPTVALDEMIALIATAIAPGPAPTPTP